MAAELATMRITEQIDALEVMAYALRVESVQVATELDPDLPSLSADGHQLQQVLVNLVTNAHQAMRAVDGPRRLTIRSGADRAEGQVWLDVADSGPGIAPEVEARLFEPFFTTKPVGQGTGLGLAISHEIVRSLGGTIAVESAPGIGTVFTISLPIARASRDRFRARSSVSDQPANLARSASVSPFTRR